jgi:hypothetical protein
VLRRILEVATRGKDNPNEMMRYTLDSQMYQDVKGERGFLEQSYYIQRQKLHMSTCSLILIFLNI